MAKPSALDRLNSDIKDYLQKNLLPHLSEDERLEYKQEYLGRIKFRKNWFTPDKLALLDDVDESSANVLYAIIAQALFGREEMMEYFWFIGMHAKHGARLDVTPKGPHPEFEKLQASTYSQVYGSGPSQDTANKTTNKTTKKPACSTADLLESLRVKIEEINESEARLHKELEAIFSTLAKTYPGLRGLLCGVRHSFRDRDDRCAERKALFSATTEYIEEMGNETSS